MITHLHLEALFLAGLDLAAFLVASPGGGGWSGASWTNGGSLFSLPAHTAGPLSCGLWMDGALLGVGERLEVGDRLDLGRGIHFVTSKNLKN